MIEVPLHITQRGVNRCAIFLDRDDRKHYLDLLHSTTEHHDIDVHAYVLMGNHVHLLVTTYNNESISAVDSSKQFKIYTQWLSQGTNEEDLVAIRSYLEQEKALGSHRFQAMVERTLGRGASWRPRGRPVK